MSIYVFLGPTLPVDRARAILDATYLPPVACGDVQALLEHGPRPTAIAIIDGLFRTRPAVFHKEILYALHEGVPVYGGSSMGALRAAELASFGMIGVGKIFDAFASGELEDDDEVAVAHGTADQRYAPISDAMVSVRLGLARAVRENVITAPSERRLVELAKATFYAERSWRFLFARGVEVGVPHEEIARLRAFVDEQKPDAKRDDAIALLEHLARLDRAPTTGAASRFAFAPSARFRRLKEEVRRSGRFGLSLGRGVPIDKLALQARLFADPERQVLDEALFVHLVEDAALHHGVSVSEDEAARWLAEQGRDATPAALAAATHELLVRRFKRRSSRVRSAIDGHVATALERARRASALEEHWLLVAQASTNAAASGAEQGSWSDGELVRWYSERIGRAQTIEDLCAAFDVSASELLEALAIGREAERRSGGSDGAS